MWNLRPERMVMVHTVPSLLEVTDSARFGWGSPLASRIMSVSNTVRAYMIPTSSKVPWVGEKPFSSASTPKVSEPPVLGVADETPFGWDPVEPPEAVVELVLEPELPQAANTLPAAMPAPATAPLARNERRSMRSVMVPLWTVVPAGAGVVSMRCQVLHVQCTGRT